MNWFITFFSLLGFAFLLGCNDVDESTSDDIIVNSEIQDVLDGLLEEQKIPRNANYRDILDVLFDLGIYTFDSDDFLDCKKDGLQSYYLRRQLPVRLVKKISLRTDAMTGNEIFDYVLRVAGMNTNELENEFHVLSSDKNPENITNGLQDNIVTHLIWLASKRGNVEALNEIGAAQIYCYQGTEQDVDSAIVLLQKAADKGDSLAMLTLGKIYYTGLGGYSDVKLGKTLQEQAFEKALDELRAARQDIE